MNKYDEAISTLIEILNNTDECYNKDLQSIDFTIKCLQQAKERECGCEYCNTTLKAKPIQLFNIGDGDIPYEIYAWIYKNNLSIRIKYQEHELCVSEKIKQCPNCGRKLGDKNE